MKCEIIFDDFILLFSSVQPFGQLVNLRPSNVMENHVSGQSNKPMSKPAHALDCDTLVRELGADPENGFSEAQAGEKLNEFGRNELDDGPGVQPIKILIRQVANAMMLVLIMAMVVSFAIESWIEGGVVTAVIVLNIVVGFLQEFQAEKTMDSLRSLSSPTANVVRDGSIVNVPTAELVVGDVVVLKVGDTVPADLRYVVRPLHVAKSCTDYCPESLNRSILKPTRPY